MTIAYRSPRQNRKQAKHRAAKHPRCCAVVWGLWRWYKLLGSGSFQIALHGAGRAHRDGSSQGSKEEARSKAARQRSSLGLGLRRSERVFHASECAARCPLASILSLRDSRDEDCVFSLCVVGVPSLPAAHLPRLQEGGRAPAATSLLLH